MHSLPMFSWSFVILTLAGTAYGAEPPGREPGKLDAFVNDPVVLREVFHKPNRYEDRPYDFWYENWPQPHVHGNQPRPDERHQHFDRYLDNYDFSNFITDPPLQNAAKNEPVEEEGPLVEEPVAPIRNAHGDDKPLDDEGSGGNKKDSDDGGTDGDRNGLSGQGVRGHKKGLDGDGADRDRNAPGGHGIGGNKKVLGGDGDPGAKTGKGGLTAAHGTSVTPVKPELPKSAKKDYSQPAEPQPIDYQSEKLTRPISHLPTEARPAPPTQSEHASGSENGYDVFPDTSGYPASEGLQNAVGPAYNSKPPGSAPGISPPYKTRPSGNSPNAGPAPNYGSQQQEVAPSLGQNEEPELPEEEQETLQSVPPKTPSVGQGTHAYTGGATPPASVAVPSVPGGIAPGTADPFGSTSTGASGSSVPAYPADTTSVDTTVYDETVDEPAPPNSWKTPASSSASGTYDTPAPAPASPGSNYDTASTSGTYEKPSVPNPPPSTGNYRTQPQAPTPAKQEYFQSPPGTQPELFPNVKLNPENPYAPAPGSVTPAVDDFFPEETPAPTHIPAPASVETLSPVPISNVEESVGPRPCCPCCQKQVAVSQSPVGGCGATPNCGPPPIVGTPPVCCPQPPTPCCPRLPTCCIPQLPCCPRIQIPCCPPIQICCQQVGCSSGCRSRALTRVRTKRLGCVPCIGRKKRDIFDELVHTRQKRLGCIPCLAREKRHAQQECQKCNLFQQHVVTRVKRTFSCNTCATHAERVKRQADINDYYRQNQLGAMRDCQKCYALPLGGGSGGVASVHAMRKRSVMMSALTDAQHFFLARMKRAEDTGYDPLFKCDAGCCDYGKCIRSKPLRGQTFKVPSDSDFVGSSSDYDLPDLKKEESVLGTDADTDSLSSALSAASSSSPSDHNNAASSGSDLFSGSEGARDGEAKVSESGRSAAKEGLLLNSESDRRRSHH